MLTKAAMQEKNYELYFIGGAKVESHLSFVDNVIFFVRASTQTFRALRSILDEFTRFSRLGNQQQ